MSEMGSTTTTMIEWRAILGLWCGDDVGSMAFEVDLELLAGHDFLKRAGRLSLTSEGEAVRRRPSAISFFYLFIKPPRKRDAHAERNAASCRSCHEQPRNIRNTTGSLFGTRPSISYHLRSITRCCSSSQQNLGRIWMRLTAVWQTGKRKSVRNQSSRWVQATQGYVKEGA